MITSAQIHDKEFERKFRGYDEQAVDEYLDQLAAYIDNLSLENKELREKLKTTADQLTYMKNLEDTLRETLVTAQRSAEETGRNAAAKAEEIVSTANEQARRILQKAKDEAAAAQRQIDELQRQASVYRSNFRMLMQAQLQILEDSTIGREREERQAGEQSGPTKRRGVLCDEPLTNLRRQANQEDASSL